MPSIPPALSLLIAVIFATVARSAPSSPERNVLLVTIDGLRWQEVFRGADDAILNTEFGGIPEKEVAAARNAAFGSTAGERRKKLMPFLWTEIAVRGQIFGNRDRGSLMNVTNAEWFSYPGYNELLCGFSDPLITSNAPIPNRNVTVLEWLNGRPPFAGRVAAAVTWHVLPAILNVGRSRLPVWVSSRNPGLAAQSPRFADLDRWMQDVPIKARDEHYDAFAFRAALALLEELQPRVLYVAFGEPDTTAHRRRYDAYLESITRCDRFVRELWEKLQSLERYRGTTTLLITTDHGRGMEPADWISHGRKIPGAGETWLAVIGPDTLPAGEEIGHTPIFSAQVAATLAAAVGENLPAAEPLAATAIKDALKSR